MSTVVKTIKSYLTDDTIYPITKASAVYMANSTIDTVESKITNLEINKLDKDSPIITGSTVSLIGQSITTGEIPSEYKRGNSIYFKDKDGVIIGQIHSFQSNVGDGTCAQGIRILGWQGDPTPVT